MIGAVFGEWAGAHAGLGRLVLLDLNQLETARVYAGVILLALMAVSLFALACAVERLAVPWAHEASGLTGDPREAFTNDHLPGRGLGG